jgi:hypothetical protein
MRDRDLSGYWKLLRAIFPPEPRPIRGARAESPAPPVELVHRPTLDRSQVRGRVLAMLQKADKR